MDGDGEAGEGWESGHAGVGRSGTRSPPLAPPSRRRDDFPRPAAAVSGDRRVVMVLFPLSYCQASLSALITPPWYLVSVFCQQTQLRSIRGRYSFGDHLSTFRLPRAPSFIDVTMLIVWTYKFILGRMIHFDADKDEYSIRAWQVRHSPVKKKTRGAQSAPSRFLGSWKNDGISSKTFSVLRKINFISLIIVLEELVPAYFLEDDALVTSCRTILGQWR